MCSKFQVLTIVALIGLLTQTPTTHGAKILAVYAMAGRSHFQMHSAIIKELVRHGHEVTMITAQTLKPLKLGKNYTEILIEPEFEIWEYMTALVDASGGASIPYDMTSDLSILVNLGQKLGVASTEHALKQPKVQEVINAKQTKGVYDLLLVEQCVQEAFLALAHVYDVPVISTATFAQQSYMSGMFGFISPLSYVPFNPMPLTDHMTFWERVKNTYYTIYFDLDRQMRYYFPQQDVLVKKYFGHLAIDFPSTTAMSKNLSAILINNYTPLALPGPKMDNMINVGGMHIYPNKPLPSDIQKFLDEAEHGAIYFSLGTHILAKDMPQEKLQIFLDVFRNLKQRVLWKFENDNLTNVPNNVMIKPWMPQNDILPHPNIRAFISHGGLFGSQEAVYYGVPVVGIPFIFDQEINVNNGVRAGYTVKVDIHTLTHDDLKNAIHKVLYEPKYRETMKRMSKIFRDRPMGPRETAMYWIDYVIRHKGARHMRAAGLDLEWYQFYLLDVIALFAIAVAVPLGLALVLLRWSWQKLNRRSGKQKVQ